MRMSDRSAGSTFLGMKSSAQTAFSGNQMVLSVPALRAGMTHFSSTRTEKSLEGGYFRDLEASGPTRAICRRCSLRSWPNSYINTTPELPPECCMARVKTKTEVASIKLTSHCRLAWEAAASVETRSLANMFEVAILEYCKRHRIAVPDVAGEGASTEPSRRMAESRHPRS